MTKSVESIVRPFQAGEVWTQSRLAPIPFQTNVLPPEDVVTEWEGAADSTYVDENNAWCGGFSSDLKEDKSQRKSRTVEVRNPDDPDQKVFVERIDSTVFKDDKGREQKFKFDWSNPQDGP